MFSELPRVWVDLEDAELKSQSLLLSFRHNVCPVTLDHRSFRAIRQVRAAFFLHRPSSQAPRCRTEFERSPVAAMNWADRTRAAKTKARPLETGPDLTEAG